MEIFDCHVHSFNVEPNPERLLGELAKAGVTGCTIFSNRPIEENSSLGTDFSSRLNEITAWTKGYEDRLFPVLWVHPDEENLNEKLETAVNNGVLAFKVICNNFYYSSSQ